MDLYFKAAFAVRIFVQIEIKALTGLSGVQVLRNRFPCGCSSQIFLYHNQVCVVYILAFEDAAGQFAEFAYLGFIPKFVFISLMISVAGLPLALSLSAWFSAAAPSPDNIALARQYAPQWKFHPSEVYWPSTVEYFLSGVQETDASGNVVNALVTNSNVDDPANQGSGLFLTTDIDSGKQGFLRGQNPSTTATSAYTFIASKPNGVVDLYYWLFTPFNEGKNVPAVGEVGDHVGDWERMAVRTVNGVATQVDYHAHGDKGSGTIPWSQAIKFDNDQRPVGYVAKGSHGFWATAGTFTYVNAVVFKLQDVTADGGVAWDTRDSLVTFDYPDTFSGSQDWVNYKGAWGNLGQTNCWWYKIHPECEVTTGPPGPLRADVLGSDNLLKVAAKITASAPSQSMSGPLSHTLGTVSKDSTSSYGFYIDASAYIISSKAGHSRLTVQQNCISIEEGSASKPNTAILTSTQYASTLLNDATKYTVSVDACEENYAVNSYTLGLCKDDTSNDCTWSTSSRVLRAFSPEVSVRAVQHALAIVVEDLDLWKWQ